MQWCRDADSQGAEGGKTMDDQQRGMARLDRTMKIWVGGGIGIGLSWSWNWSWRRHEEVRSNLNLGGDEVDVDGPDGRLRVGWLVYKQSRFDWSLEQLLWETARLGVDFVGTSSLVTPHMGDDSVRVGGGGGWRPV